MEDYIEKVKRTESIDFDAIAKRLSDPHVIRLLHAAIGKSTEAGEFIDTLKKYIFYGKPIDEVNLKEEIGDGFWYDGIACDELKTDFDAEQKRNIAKLQARYPDKFNSGKADNRDLDIERKVLENE